MNLGWSGRTVFANECGEQFNFVDLDGHIPKDRVMASVRAEMEGQPKHWVRPGTIDSTTDRGPKGLSKVKLLMVLEMALQSDGGVNEDSFQSALIRMGYTSMGF